LILAATLAALLPLQSEGPMAKPVDYPPPWITQRTIQEDERFRRGPVLDEGESADTVVEVIGGPCAFADAYYCYDPVLLERETGGVQNVKIVVEENGVVSECYGPKLPENPALLNQTCRVAKGIGFSSCTKRPDLPCRKREFEYYYSWLVPVSGSLNRLPKPAHMPEFDTSPRKGQPISLCGNLICPDDYPERSLALGEQGNVASADGLPIQCWVFEPSGYPELDNATCGIMLSRMRFKPATDANNRPIESVYTNQISWRIPE
jgi:hypothetical protein